MSWGKTREEMTQTEQRLLVAVEEGTALGYITMRETNHLPDGTTKKYPARDPQECSRILVGWFDAGLIELGHLIPADPNTLRSADVPFDEARALLSDPSKWDFSREVGVTAKGEDSIP
jgi:hypothetical protein